MRLSIAIGIMLGAVIVAQAAHAEYEPPACRKLLEEKVHRPWEVVREALDRCERTAMGVVPLERLAHGGERVYRAIVYPGERRLPLFIEFHRRPGGPVLLDVSTNYEGARHLHRQVPQARWLAIEAQWLAQWTPPALTHEAPQQSAGPEMVCISQGAIIVEAIRADGVSSREIDGCDAINYAFSNFLIAEAVNDAGACARENDSDEDSLLHCLSR